jgi:hypothetical protein
MAALRPTTTRMTSETTAPEAAPSADQDSERQPGNDGRERAEPTAQEAQEAQRKDEAPDAAAAEAIDRALEEDDGEGHRGRQAGERYIDRRSGGNYLYAHQLTIVGDLVGQSQTRTGAAWTGASSDHAVTGRLSAEQLNEIRTVFASPPSYSNVVQRLMHDRLLVCRGPDTIGKATIAVHALLDCEARDVQHLNPVMDGGQLLSFHYQHACGYVVEDLAAGTARHLTAASLREVQDRVRQSASHLIMTVDDDVRLSQEVVDAFVVDCNGMPEPELVLERHLDWRLDGAVPTGLRTSEAIGELLRSNPAPADVSHLAELLVRHADGEMTFAEALAKFDPGAAPEVAEWFAEERDLSAPALLLSVAVLGGGSYQSVVEAAERLQRELLRTDRHGAKVTSPLFARARRSRLQEVRARVVRGYAGGEAGSHPVDLVEFERESWYQAVLRHVWDEYDLARPPLLRWLRSLCADRDPTVRERAATAVGKLAEYDFGYVWQNILRPWASDEDEKVRRSVGLALGIPAQRDALAAHVLKALARWSNETNAERWRLPWTAAAAFGTHWIGVRFPDAALRCLDLILRHEDLKQSRAVADSLVGLFELDPDNSSYRQRILDAALAWSAGAERSKHVRTWGLVGFLRIAYQVQTVVSEQAASRWPALLWLAESDPVLATGIVLLLRRGLEFKETRRASLLVLHDWTTQAGRKARLRHALERLLSRLAEGEGRERERLCSALERWQNDRKRALPVAGDLRQALTAE